MTQLKLLRGWIKNSISDQVVAGKGSLEVSPTLGKSTPLELSCSVLSQNLGPGVVACKHRTFFLQEDRALSSHVVPPNMEVLVRPCPLAAETVAFHLK